MTRFGNIVGCGVLGLVLAMQVACRSREPIAEDSTSDAGNPSEDPAELIEMRNLEAMWSNTYQEKEPLGVLLEKVEVHAKRKKQDGSFEGNVFLHSSEEDPFGALRLASGDRVYEEEGKVILEGVVHAVLSKERTLATGNGRLIVHPDGKFELHPTKPERGVFWYPIKRE